MERTCEHGTLILNRDDDILYSLKTRIAAIARKKNLRVIWYTTHPLPNRLNSPEYGLLRSALKIPGDHNISNAMAVVELGK